MLCAVLLSWKAHFSFGAETHGVKGIGTAVAGQLSGFLLSLYTSWQKAGASAHPISSWPSGSRSVLIQNSTDCCLCGVLPELANHRDFSSLLSVYVILKHKEGENVETRSHADLLILK